MAGHHGALGFGSWGALGCCQGEGASPPAAKLGKDSLCWKGDLAPPRGSASFSRSVGARARGCFSSPSPGLGRRHRHRTRGKRQRTLPAQAELGGERVSRVCLGFELGRRRARPACAVPIRRMCMRSSQVLCNLPSCFLPLFSSSLLHCELSGFILSLAGWGCAPG